MELEYMGNDEWLFGEKIRGTIRHPKAAVYFDKGYDHPDGDWVWVVYSLPTNERMISRGYVRSRAVAIEAVESFLEIK